MADTTEVLVVTQPEGETFDVAHCGTVGVQGVPKGEPIGHHGEIVHATPPERPLVHMLLWDEDCACTVNGRIVLAGDEKSPVQARLVHHFENDHRQTHRIETALADPIHHALQMRTPLQVRFCNTWQIASDYSIEINLGNNRLIGVRVTGATVAKPQPCDDDKPCEPVVSRPVHP